MDTEFGSYVERTIKRFNKTWAETDLMALGDSADPHGQIVEIELDPMRTRKRIKTPLLAQSTGDIHRSVVKSQTKTLGACNRCLLRFPCIMVSICIFLGMFVLLYFIFILPSCGALLKKPNCILFRKPGQILAPPTPL